MDRNDGIFGSGRIGVRLHDSTTLSPWGAQKGSRDGAGVAADAKRYRRRADRRIDLAFGIATPIERRLPENDSSLRV